MSKPIQLYHLENYLFESVSTKFGKTGILNAFDFFCIVIWKANRAKSKIYRLLTNHKSESIENLVEKLSKQIFHANSARERMRILIKDYGFRLPMASAILTVLYPDDFTVYDERVCRLIDDYYYLANKTKFESLWKGYQDFIQAVRNTTPEHLSLRDKDRYLWGKSFAHDLERNLLRGFDK